MSRLNRRDIYTADDIERIVNRNAKWFRDLVREGVKATQRSGRPLYTEKIPLDERLAARVITQPHEKHHYFLAIVAPVERLKF